MARRQVSMNEIVEMVYQWHQGEASKALNDPSGRTERPSANM